MFSHFSLSLPSPPHAYSSLPLKPKLLIEPDSITIHQAVLGRKNLAEFRNRIVKHMTQEEEVVRKIERGSKGRNRNKGQ